MIMKISTTNLRRKDGTKLVNGYKISLQKSEVESIGMHDGTELVPFFDERLTFQEHSAVLFFLYLKLKQ